MEALRPTPVTPEEQERLAENRAAFDQRLDEIREANKARASVDVVREQGGAVVRIAAQGE
jgi:hypothetical protein